MAASPQTNFSDDVAASIVKLDPSRYHAVSTRVLPMNQAEKYAAENFGALDNSALVSVRVAAAVKNCSVPTIWRRIKTDKLSTVTDGHMLRVTVASVRASMIGGAE